MGFAGERAGRTFRLVVGESSWRGELLGRQFGFSVQNGTYIVRN